MSSPDLSVLSDAEKAEYLKALELQNALLSPLDYACHVTEEAERYKHIELLNAHIVALVEHRLYPAPHGILPEPAVRDAEGEYRHPETGVASCTWLAISMPPRHGKSYLVSDHTPAWYLTRYPKNNVILTSYEAEFAKSWGARARQHVGEFPEFGIHIDNERRAADNWEIFKFKGSMRTAGAGGAITGKGAHLMVIDDPTKNAEDAMSETQRNKLWDWYKSTVDTRLEPGAVGILMATRWHEDDLIGKATSGNPSDYYVLNLPALAFDEADPDTGISVDPDTGGLDPIGRAPGEALCPQRYSRRELEKRRDGTGESTDAGAESDEPAGRYWFNALYQGRPQIEGGGLISKPFCYHTLSTGREGIAPFYTLYDAEGQHMRTVQVDECTRFATLDLAASLKTHADWTVFAVWDVTRERELLLVDRIRKRLETPDHAPLVRQWCEEFDVKYVAIESATYGLGLIQQLLRDGKPSVRSLKADKDKITRTIPYANLIDNGKVFFPRNAAWLQDWEDEHCKFPNSRHDDQVDVGAYAAIEMDRIPLLVRSTERYHRDDRSMEARRYRRAQDLDKAERKGSKARPKLKVHPVLGRWG